MWCPRLLFETPPLLLLLWFCATLRLAEPLEPPTDFSLSTDTDSAFLVLTGTLTWAAPVDMTDVTQYAVYAALGPACTDTATSPLSDALGVIDGGLQAYDLASVSYPQLTTNADAVESTTTHLVIKSKNIAVATCTGHEDCLAVNDPTSSTCTAAVNAACTFVDGGTETFSTECASFEICDLKGGVTLASLW